MIVYFADRQLSILGQASTELPKGLTVIEDLKTEDVETGVSVFECKIPFDKRTRAKVLACVEVGNYILRSHENENEFYTIIDSEVDTKRQEVYIYAEDAGLDLLNEVVGAYEADKAYPISHYINKFAYDSGFEIGINEAASLTRKLSWDGEATVTERIASVATQFGGYEVSYSYEIHGLEITGKYINIHKQRGQDNGVQLRLNKDIDGIVIKKSIANLATALECTGGTPEDTNIEDDIDPVPITLKGYSYDDGDFYVSGSRLYSREALKTWSRYVWSKEPNQVSGNVGHIIRSFSYDTLSQSTLCAHALTELKKIREVEVNYEVDVTNWPKGTKIGDRVNIVDDEDELYVSARILLLETSVADQKKKVTLGEYLIRNSGISDKVSNLAAQFAKTSQSAAKALAITTSALAISGEAKTQAGSAYAESASAQKKAEDAQASASSAQASASSAQNSATQAKEAVENVERDVEELEASVVNETQATNERITTAESLIQQLSNCIAMLVTDENGESLMTQTENGWTFSMKETSEAVSSLTRLLETLQQETGSTEATVDTLRQAVSDHGETLEYVTVTTYEDEPCIKLGESDSNFKLLITNTRIMFMNGANVPTYINTNGLVTQNIEVKGEIVQGGYVMLNTADGGWGLLWKGVSS